ncbi:glycosyltransferase family 4 protein [Pseudaminobacter soli (ex Li et al. 2025)]|uniref:Glycosyltransferase family 1 protein n=1 Tax=Pseudaminobacter soli (ex Li et al. 2025) TaxID=1295366 RepID=A0A2P7S850_9HYPH|nr:glycosyltransferase family 1 protein [Mesorhizobium soli]PSJ58640.1 glycosyltransferase family 1 protein [Mesorhizobium soli]
MADNVIPFSRAPSATTGNGRTDATGHSVRKRRWTINGDFVALNPTGVARYAREVTLALDTLIAEGHPLARDLSLDMVTPRPAQLPLRAIAVRVVPEYSKPRLPQFWVQAQLPRHVPGGLLSFCNLAPVAVSRHIVCIHDLHTRLMPDSYGRLFRWAHRLILPLLGRRAARIATVSQLSRQHLVSYGIATADKITVTYNGSDHAAKWKAGRSKLWPERPYVLCLGRPQKYKNIELLVRLAPLLHSMGLDLWMAGDVDETTVSSIVSPVPHNLRLLGRVSDDDFKKALEGALCFLFPSRIEGFGLPAVEAMASGCPVVASTSPCLPEVCGQAALYADPDDLDAWADAVGSLRFNSKVRQMFVEAGLKQASRYGWRGIAETYLQLTAEVDAEAAG